MLISHVGHSILIWGIYKAGYRGCIKNNFRSTTWVHIGLGPERLVVESIDR